MPLDNTAKLSDIITALQTMEGINAKVDLASVVGSPATANDTIATINSVIQGAKNTLATKMDDGSSGAEPLKTLVDRLTMGKKSASGSYTTTTDGNITVNGLGFSPSIIIVNDSNNIKVYFEDTTGITNYTFSRTGSNRSTGAWTIGADSFFTNMNNYSAVMNLNWYAIG